MPNTSLDRGIGTRRRSLNTGSRKMFSFKTKLVVYFLLISLLPAAGVFWAFSSLATRDEAHRADVRLEAAVRLAVSQLDAELSARADAAEQLARDPGFQQALERHDLTTLTRLVAGRRDVELTTRDGARIGVAPPKLTAVRSVNVRTSGGSLGSVSAYLPYDVRLARRLHGSSGLGDREPLAIVVGGKVVAAIAS